MARGDSEKKAKWSAWITAKLTDLGMRPNDLVRASDGALNDSTVSNWTVGRAGVSAETAVVVAEALGIDLVEVLRAGSHDVLANAVAAIQKGAPARPTGTRIELDDTVRFIFARNDLTEEEQADAIVYYEKRKARIVAEMAALTDAMIASRAQTDAETG